MGALFAALLFVRRSVRRTSVLDYARRKWAGK